MCNSPGIVCLTKETQLEVNLGLVKKKKKEREEKSSIKDLFRCERPWQGQDDSEASQTALPRKEGFARDTPW